MEARVVSDDEVGVTTATFRRGTILMAVASMRSSGFAAGDMVVLQRCSGRQRSRVRQWAAAEVWPWPRVEQGCVAMGGVMRFNAGAGLGDSVAIRPASPPEWAFHIVVRFLQPIDASSSSSSSSSSAPSTAAASAPGLLDSLRQQLMGRAFLAGNRFRVPYRGDLHQFEIVSVRSENEDHANDKRSTTSTTTSLKQLFRCHAARTTISIESTVKRVSSAVTSSSTSSIPIGGMRHQLATVLEVVHLPIREPELFEQLGVAPSRGVLLYGPPGTGKTMLVRHVAETCGCATVCINGPDIVGKYYGESEARLRAVFQEARASAPSIVFIDEIDALCPSRDEATQESEKRLVGTLLTLIDELNEAPLRAHVVVMGATNRVDSLDAALRRPGRFDVEVECGVPNVAERQLILEALLATVPHSIDASAIAKCARDSHGFVGADLSAVVKEAGLLALHRTRTLDGSGGRVLELTTADFLSAFPRVRPSAMREVVVDIPRVRWEDIGGQTAVKARLREAVEWPLRHPEAFARMGIRPPRGLLLYGPPGCSKTLTAKALATESGLNFIAVKGPELFSKWVGESERAVRELFRRARLAAPSIIFFDEIDAMAGQRSGGTGGGGVGDRVLSQLLLELDGIEPLKQVIVLAATNRPDLVDTALLRPGRIDRVMYVGPPDEGARADIFRIAMRPMPVADDVRVERLAAATDGYSGAEITAVCREAALLAMDADRDARLVEREHFVRAMLNITAGISASSIEFYDKFTKTCNLNVV